MKFLQLFLIIATLFLTSCDPKVNERADRYDPADCPTCHEGECSYCNGNKECTQCDSEGQRGTSTENYTGEGIELVDLTTDCPFCKGTNLCSYCEGTGKCYRCNGEGSSDNWETGIEKYKNSREED